MGLFDNIVSGGKKLAIGGLDSIIGENARFKGEIVSVSGVSINGEFEGKIKAEGEIIVTPNGKVVGEIHGGTVVVAGRVDGNIIAKDILEVSKSGRVHGDLTGGKIVIEEGSTYHGRVRVESGPLSAEVESVPAEEQTDTQPKPLF